MAKYIVTFEDLVAIARSTGVENWTDAATGQRGKVIAAPSSHRGQHGEMGTVVGITRHHTGTLESFKPSEDYPTYQVVKEGRVGLENSLSAYGLGRWFGIYVFSEDISWHAGVWSYAGVTDGNGHFLGIEAESAGNLWTEFQEEFYPRLCAAILHFIGEGIDMMPRHADGAMPRGRKVDAANLPASFAARVATYLADPSTIYYGKATPPPVEQQEEEDMTPIIVNVVDTAGSNKGIWLMDVIGYHNAGSTAVVRELRRIGAKEISIPQAVHNAFVAEQNRLRSMGPAPEPSMSAPVVE